MTLERAKEILNTYFANFTELHSIAHEVTDDGVITKQHLKLLSDEELIDVAYDAEYETLCEIGFFQVYGS